MLSSQKPETKDGAVIDLEEFANGASPKEIERLRSRF
jgi:hypothetical protein